ncbi:methylenetetrahydrofolate reductase [NAD(P)H] [Paraburkholderia caballeronis]|uniref:Methylenetetrahydrofolate reductase n=1 Tax=Paraburkholderia caballeronis TaxID=416943 RepID=A0A1H7SJH0_9BURK|nr:methylenetetrahydrofolate reductase [NAD(P)H] [Paraburkholderia caballeronis]PXW22340.1 5,10-methylenetetrahydrofolate reductase (NAD(P)) [Paraburkholderia caballeronis]PXW95998.1 5,10-methylenetetrahydrofolate reductase (NAD(P)) [Paraburkholderia caballeronis]RAJ92364.1 5,10-methylenetetrahydrofolate reductase (NAD(P)) [Paraburkholderia caballeronis]SEB51259.1 5,10-methylenetetrahydrofolate reductase (NAD(P)) [Paraburkholderia caballeronis]SEL72780.1 5,10-methylenetetrahydrofolate reductas
MKPIELSFEFFPPKTQDGMDKLRATRAQLALLKPKFVSVTFGAGGSTQQGTLDTVLDIAKEGVEAAPHLSCIGSSKESLRAILARYRSHGIRHIVALRGDLPSGMGEVGELRYASELVAFIREETGDAFHIEVAAYPEYHPQARSPRHDLEAFARKVKAGADSAITQYFFNADAYFRFVDDARKLGVDVPIVPGIMPITNYSQLMRFSEMCGAEVPRWIAKRLESYGDDRESIRAFGVDVVADLCRRLADADAPGLHFYTLNNAAATAAICERIGG